ncbi:MAG: amidohydrolase family protein, partial [Pseudomonadota bacterium]|nr:amidohydrolase family protein [Pseudomonadota bacterium]
PELAVVIDHAAKPPLALAWDDPAMRAWRRDMAALAALPHVHCKMSGLLTELSPGDRTSHARSIPSLRPVVDALLDWFGPGRLMWGSDWPVLTLAGGYDDWIAVSDALLCTLAAAERAQVLDGTAQHFYGLG